jgi:GTP-binding protein HflX
VIFIKNEVQGNTEGVKAIYLWRLKQLYNLQLEPRQLISSELLDELVFLTDELNREIAVYLSRKGQVIQVSVGEHNKVSLEEASFRRGTERLSKIRCIHTHPQSSGRLSAVDLATLHQLRFDCMAAIGVKAGSCLDIWVGFINPEGYNQTLAYGPFTRESIKGFNYLDILSDIEKKLIIESQPLENFRERALLVGVEFTNCKSELFDPKESLEELRELAEAAGAEIAEKVFQGRSKPDSAYYIGSGLVEDIALMSQALKLDIVIIDGEISGSQQKNLEKRLGIKVIDRTGLILDIFAQRAKSREGKLQVELAQLEYLLPRLTVGAQLGLSRLAGGIGTRGPGETKLEQDRRRLRARITDLKRELERVEERRSLLKSGRTNNVPVVALVGYTNAGKSTLRYRLLKSAATHNVNWTQEDAGTNHLFATLDPTVRGIMLPNGEEILLADTVGFIQRLPHKLISAFKATLEEVIEADLLLHVVDGSNPNYEQQMLAVNQVLAELQVAHKKNIIVYNKIDLVGKEQYFYNVTGHPSVELSALTGKGIPKLLALMENILGLEKKEVCLAIPYQEGKLIATLHQEGKVKQVDYQNQVVMLKVAVNKSLYRKVEQYII